MTKRMVARKKINPRFELRIRDTKLKQGRKFTYLRIVLKDVEKITLSTEREMQQKIYLQTFKRIIRKSSLEEKKC